MRSRLRAAAVAAIFAGAPFSAAAEGKTVEFGGSLQNLAVIKSDSDFDGSKALYQPDGQSVGYFATFLDPGVEVGIGDSLRVRYDGELGLNLWSRNRVEFLPKEAANDVLFFKHRQAYSQARVSEKSHLRAGYQYFSDPTRLFMSYYVGAARLGTSTESYSGEALVGQLPDQTSEGIDLTRNNFNHDVFLFAASASKGGEALNVNPALIALYDGQRVGRPTWLLTETTNIGCVMEGREMGVDLAAQVGGTRGGSFTGETETHLAGAVQAYMAAGRGRQGRSRGTLPTEIQRQPASAGESGWMVGALLLSPDDGDDRNGRNTAFHYSGKSRSQTLLLTENELRDVGDNLDEGMGEKAGLFTIVRSGLAVAEGSVYYGWMENWELSTTLAAASVLQPRNALGEVFVGVEADAGIRHDFSRSFSLDVVGSILIPGGAAGAFFNRIDPEAARPVFAAQSSLRAAF
ncbi:MAG: hypothetical protein HYT87_16735 [Nitrospirae bacterium]|nr:hypothetical protein [Nitrospirota bacterium]